MAIPISRFVPRARTPLNWSADPLFGLKKESITPTQGRAGLAYNRSLYEPDSASARALTAGRPAEAWQGAAAPVRTGAYTSRYGTASIKSGAQYADEKRAEFLAKPFSGGDQYTDSLAAWMTANPGTASISPAASRSVENPNLTFDTGLDDGAIPDMPPPGVAGPAGATGIQSPSLSPPAPVPSPYLEEGSVDSLLPPGPTNLGSPEVQRARDQNPLNAQPPNARDNSAAAQTTRYYDRKFSRNSRDPVERMQSRRIDGRAPNVSVRPNRVTFQNNVAGHSSWQPYD